MPRSLRSEAQEVLLERLKAARKKAGLTQQSVAETLGRPQSFVAKYERGDRRLDVVEFLEVTAVLGADPKAILRAMAKHL